MRLQHLIFVKLRLLSSLCDIILAEGACGDVWHDLKPPGGGSNMTGGRVEKSHVAVERRRHPGGLGGVVPVVSALAVKAATPAAAPIGAVPGTTEYRSEREARL